MLSIGVFHSCATYRPQFNTVASTAETKKEVSHTFYLAGGMGNEKNLDETNLFSKFEKVLQTADNNSTLLYLGDNISRNKDQWSSDTDLIDKHLSLSKNFKGEITFLSGVNEWKNFNIDSLERVENYLKDVDDEADYVVPKNGCPLEYKEINDDLALIFVDSNWFIANWSRVEGINAKCTDVVTRRRFMEELEGMINDAQGKNVVIAMHHPVFSNGSYAGNYSLKSHLTPLPVLGTLLNGIDDLASFSPTHNLSRRFLMLRILVSSLAKKSDRVTVVSGHEESLQYLSGGDIHQIISGSLGSKSETKISKDIINAMGGSLPFEGKFTFGENGFAKLEYFKDGSSQVTFRTSEENFTFPVLDVLADDIPEKEYQIPQQDSITVAVREDTASLNRTGFYKFLWGERYRKYFGVPVTAPTTILDTLYGGLYLTKKGGGHQSYSLRLEDDKEREFAMRSLRKNALKYLKFSVRGVAYQEEEYRESLPKELISDFFTTAHPYMQMVINPMAREVDVNHANTQLFYIPKQSALKNLNPKFGDALYFIEQRPSDEQLNYKGYRRTVDGKGKITEFESTTDMLEKIKSDESYTVDQQSYVRARVFDMLLGDWDRHQDQWRWAEYEKENGDKEFMPVPRDRDNAFPKFDGTALQVIQWFIPITRAWQSYGPEIENLKWLNFNGSRLDNTILPDYDADGWEREAKYIQEHLSEETIDMAFLRLPKEVQDSTSQYIKNSLKKRLQKLPEYAREYAKYLNKRVALHATEKDDKIEVFRLEDGQTKVRIERLLSDEPNEKFYERTFDPNETMEIWIYGLGDKDDFIVSGDGDAEIFVRLIGGYGKDYFDIKNPKSVKVYDWKKEEIEFEGKSVKRQLTDVYTTNTFHWRYFKPNTNVFVPTAGFRTDDGLFLGAKNTFTDEGFNGNPFRQQHTLSAKYYFNFRAAELKYDGVFANIFPKWNFEVGGFLTSDRYVKNFFEFGNETVNNEDSLTRDFYRARVQQSRLTAGLAYHTLRFRTLFESFKAEELTNRLFTPDNVDPNVFDRQNYAGAETSLYYYNDDADDFPTKGLYVSLMGGYKQNVSLKENRFGYFGANLKVVRRLIPSGDLVLATELEYKTNIGNNYFFYHAPSIGGDNGLRGFRDERFTGRSYFYQSTDLRVRLKRYVTTVTPITVGLYGGFDYGRVWQPNESSNIWHTSQGLGVWVGTANFLGLNAGVFNSVEGTFVQFGFGFGF